MLRSSTILLLAILSGQSALWAQTPIVTRVPDIETQLAPIQAIAIMPIENCPGALDCAQVEQKIYSALFEQRARWPWKPSVIAASKVRERMAELGLDSSSTNRTSIAAALGVEILVIPSVPYLGSQPQPKTLVTPEGNAPEARVELVFHQAKGDYEKTLFRGSLQRRATTYSQQEGLVSSLFRKLMAEVVPK